MNQSAPCSGNDRRVSIIIPGHNCAGTIAECISSLRTQDWPADRMEIIYVDDASTDRSVDTARCLADHVVQLSGYPRGPAAARNAGVREATGDIIIFLDADIIAPPMVVRSLVQSLLEDMHLDAVFGSYDSDPKERTLVSQYRNLLHHFVHQTSRGDASTFWAGCGAIWRESFELVGGFDVKRYRRPMIEDIELGHRMRALGMRIKLQPSIQVKHLKRWTLLGMMTTDIFARGVPWMRLLLRDAQTSGEIGDLNLRISGLLSVPLAWLVLLSTIFSLLNPGLLKWAALALGLLLIVNLKVWLCFYRLRGLLFALMILPLHFAHHLCNGISFLIALLYRVLIDRPLYGLRSLGAGLQSWYWRRAWASRQKKTFAGKSVHLPEVQER